MADSEEAGTQEAGSEQRWQLGQGVNWVVLGSPGKPWKETLNRNI